MKLTKIDSYEIQAFAFRVMTGYVAPGKDASPLADEASYEERCAAFDEWRNEHAPCILAMLHGFEALIDRNDEPTRALLDQLDAAERERDALSAEAANARQLATAACNALGVAILHDAPRAIDRLRADAERYRWLRGREDGRYMTVYAFRTDIDEVCLGDELDSAIDAARAAEQAHGIRSEK